MTLRLKKTFSFIGLSICLILLVSGVFLVNENIAYAENEQLVTGRYIYAKNAEPIYGEDVFVNNSPVAVYENPNDALKGDQDNALFYLPYTYYLEVTDEDLGNVIYKVKYLDLDELYVNIDNLTIKDENGSVIEKWEPKDRTFSDANAPYPQLSQRKLELATTVTSVNINNIDCDSSYTFKFIGSDNNNSFYVQAEKDATIIYGKAPKTSFKEFNLTTNIDAVEVYVPPIEPILPPTSNALRIIIIIGIAVPAVVIMLIIFLPRKKEAPQQDFMKSKKHDDIDYDRDRRQDNYDEQNHQN